MNFMNNMFGPISKGMCRLSIDGNIAIKTDSGYKSYSKTDGSFINCDTFVFDVGEEMFFVVPTNVVAEGDIILAGGKPKYVIKVEDNLITAINYENGTIENLLPERHVFMGNTYFYGKIVSMFGNPRDNSAENVMKYMMLSQMMKNDNSSNSMNAFAMMAFMNGNGMSNIFNGIFSSNSNKEEE